MPMLLKTHNSFSVTYLMSIPMSRTLLELFLSLSSVRQRYNNSNIPSFVTQWKMGGSKNDRSSAQNYHKMLPLFDCVNAHCMCIFDHLFFPHPKCKWNKFLFTNLIWMPFMYFIMFCHLCMKHGSLVKFSKIAKIWSWSIAFSMMGIFLFLANLFF
jgi:hypothetical protein